MFPHNPAFNAPPRLSVVRSGYSAQVLRFPVPIPRPQGFELIADFGHPNWPFWHWVMALLIITQAMIAMQAPDTTLFRPMRARPITSRPAPTRTTGPRTGRTTRTD